MAENKNKKQQDKDAFEGMAQGQWNKNRERFEFLQNGIIELAQFFGLTINPQDGTLVAYHPEKSRLQLLAPSSSPKPNTESGQKSSAVDLDLLGQAIIKGLGDDIKAFLKENPIKASVDNSVHIANNKAVLESFNHLWSLTFAKMLKDVRIVHDLAEDGSIIYKVDKQGRLSQFVDKEEKAKQDFEKNPKIIKLFITHINTVKKAILFYIMGIMIIFTTIWNICLHIENRDLELTKKEYMILRWHVNTKPESKAFMEQLDSFVKAEGISPVYDRVVEEMNTSKEQQIHNNNKN